MTRYVSRVEFEQKTAELLDAARLSGEQIVVTENGSVAFEVNPSRVGRSSTDEERRRNADIMEKLRGSILWYDDPLEPVGEEDWEALK